MSAHQLFSLNVVLKFGVTRFVLGDQDRAEDHLVLDGLRDCLVDVFHVDLVYSHVLSSESTQRPNTETR